MFRWQDAALELIASASCAARSVERSVAAECRATAFVALAGVALSVAIACATGRAFDIDPEPEPCATAADCQVTGFVGCCACDGEPRAVNRAALAKQTDICAVVECQCAGDCRCRHVADARDFDATCVHGRCRAAVVSNRR